VRAIGKPNMNRIENTVRRIVNERLKDGQLNECDLTLRDLNIIGDIFIRVLCSTCIRESNIRLMLSGNWKGDDPAMQMEINTQPEKLLLPLKAMETLEKVLQKTAELLELLKMRKSAYCWLIMRRSGN